MSASTSCFAGYGLGAGCGGDYEVRLNTRADEDDRGGHVAWEVWQRSTQTVQSDWFKASDAYLECLDLTYPPDRWGRRTWGTRS